MSASRGHADDIVVETLTADNLTQNGYAEQISTNDLGTVNTTTAQFSGGGSTVLTVSGGMSVDWMAMGAGVDNPGTEVDGSYISNLGLVYNGEDAVFTSANVANNAYLGDLTVNGSISVANDFTGNLTVEGTFFLLNEGVEENSYHEGNVLMHIGTKLVAMGGGFSASSSVTAWKWQQNGADSALDQMVLGNDGNLSLLNPGANATLTIVPSNLTLVQTIGNNTTDYPLFTYTTNTSVTVFELGEGALALDASDPDAPRIAVGNFALSSNSSSDGLVVSALGSSNTITFDPKNQRIAFSSGLSLAGNNTTMHLDFGTVTTGLAFGENATASGNHSLATQNSTASGNRSIALGNSSIASNDDAIAFVSGNASGVNAVAIGPGTVASGNYSVALGAGSIAQNWGETVVGHYNAAISGNTTTWAADDPVFVVGIGANATTGGRKNGMVISNNGTTVVNGYGYFYKPTNGSAIQQPLQINGGALFNGAVTLYDAMSMVPQGDVPMGEFGD